FKIGVPFELNHKNPLTAQPPLNQSSMHWHWQAGYKFMRAEFVINNQPRRLHLGSLHCKGEIGAISHCELPNRPAFTLTNFKLNQSAITLSLDKLLDDDSSNDHSYLTCMGGTEHPWCDNALKWLGLAGNQPQRIFSIKEGTQ
ncbi:MAG: putative repeat protein (TIGR04052 family), partial [Alteromonadaceae bacterium]